MSNDIPNLNLLAVFSAVMEQGSLSKAASQLSTNQSTISTSLSRLKKEVGQELFVRKGRGVVPTSYSLMLYQQIKAPIEQLNSVFSSMSEFEPLSSHRKFLLSSPEHIQWILLDHFAAQRREFSARPPPLCEASTPACALLRHSPSLQALAS